MRTKPTWTNQARCAVVVMQDASKFYRDHGRGDLAAYIEAKAAGLADSAGNRVTAEGVEAALKVCHGDDWPGAFDDYEVGSYRITMEKAILAAMELSD